MGLKTSENIPHLITAQARPFYELEKVIIDNRVKIESWFREAWYDTSPILTSSVDIRNAGFKIAAVDTNLFPAGFNNLNPDFYALCIQAAQSTLFELYPHCKKMLIIPENHTRNPHYYQSVATLADIVQKAGYEVKIGSMLAQKEPISVNLDSGTLMLYPIQKKDNKIISGDFTPCVIILNNDLSEGIPAILQDIAQPIEPPAKLGWSYRSKTDHFMFLNEICQAFSKLIDIDIWRIFPLFMDCGEVDFMQRDGLTCLVEKSQTLIQKIQEKYDQYQIKHPPYIVIKADAGTYGIAVMTLRDPQELTKLNRKQRTNMSISKGGRSVNRVIIQEGVYTFEHVGSEQAVAEPVVYMIGQHVIGGFYRVHKTRKIDENLNAPGMHFEKLAFAECCNNPESRQNTHLTQNQFYVYSVIARLALLASCKEKKALMT
ncbi:MAG: glutamate--cysteine ligase [Proteobacteria bacterium]|nr:glutamate--cysteine ligase [Pseudomonadota bacterium]